MPVNRSRKSNAFSLSDQTYGTLHEIIESGMADNASRAIDILANHWRLTNVAFKHGADLDQMAMDKVEEIVSDFKDKALESFTRIMEVRTSLEASREEKRLMPEVKMTYESILNRCKERTAETIEDWVVAGNWKNDILATGHTIDQFVADKFAQVQKAAVQQRTTPETIVLSSLSTDMVLYWLELQKPTSMSVGAKRFGLAFQSEKAKDLIQGMDNGHREEFKGQIHEKLKADAETRDLDIPQYLLEFQKVYDRSRGIVLEESDKQRAEKKQRILGV